MTDREPGPSKKRIAPRIRNIGIVAHINAGKTTLTERILFTTGKQAVMGEVDDGTATMDYLVEEQTRGISITAAATCVRWNDHAIQLIDTPGHVDFTAEVERSLRVMDGVIVLLDGVRGVESQTEMVWRQAERRKIPSVVFVNKMDRPGADLEVSLEGLRERLGCQPVPIVVVARDGDELSGAYDVIAGEWSWGEPSAAIAVDLLRSAAIEACADFDETILADFVEERPVEPERIHAALRRGVLARRLVPVIAGAALLNRGVTDLLDAACRYLPGPTELDPVVSVDQPDVAREPDPGAPFCALVFKSIVDGEDSWRLARVYSGLLRTGDVLEWGRGDGIRIDEFWRPHGEHREPLRVAGPGDIIAFETDQPVGTGDTLFAPDHPIRLEPVRFPRPVVSALLEPRTRDDAAVVAATAEALAADDPTLVVEVDESRGGLVVSGMGELHLSVFGNRLQRRIGERARLGRPDVAYMETVAGAGSGRAECRSPGESPMRSTVGVQVERLPAGESEVVCEVSSTDRVRPLLVELQARLRTGLSNPYPALGVRVTLTEVDGDAHGDSGGVLDLEALSVACRKAVAEAQAVLLEPVMSVGVSCPTDTLSGVLADLKSCRGRIELVESTGALTDVRALAPLEPLLGYATRLRSLTRGLGTLSMTPVGYEPVDPYQREKGPPGLDPFPTDR